MERMVLLEETEEKKETEKAGKTGKFEKAEGGWETLLWKSLLSVFVTMSMVSAVLNFLSMDGASSVLACGSGTVGVLGCGLLSMNKRTRSASFLFPVAAAALAVVFFGPGSVLRGAGGWVNSLIGWWNVRYEDAAAMFYASPVFPRDLLAFGIVAALLLGSIVWRLLGSRNFWGILCIMVVFLGLMAVLGRTSSMVLGGIFTAILGTWSFCVRGSSGRRQAVWLSGLGFSLFLAAFVFQSGTIGTIDQWREDLKKGTEVLRFGEDSLPDGELFRAHRMLEGNKPTLTVTTEQVKSLYLRGFTGGSYRNGIWTPLPKSAYGGNQAGMLDWLSGQGFHAGAQYAEYVMAGQEEMEVNRLRIENTGAVRSRIYLPYGAVEPSDLGISEKRDEGFCSSALFGERQYTCEERSDGLPSEILHAKDWVQQPETEAERSYSQAEEVYRSFVYQYYMETDEGLAPLIHNLFWSGDEVPEINSVYAAADRIRKVLQRTAALEDSENSAKEADNGESEGNKEGQAQRSPENLVLLVLGAMTAVLLLLGGSFGFLEVRRLWCFHRNEKRYGDGSEEDQFYILWRNIEAVLGTYGLEVQLGWRTQETDREVCRLFPAVPEGTYQRVSGLAERFYYGGEAPRAHELRLIESFVRKLYEKEQGGSVWKRLKLRYGRRFIS